MSTERSITALISGRGSNLRALIERQEGYRITAVVSNKRDAPGLAIAREHSIPVVVVERDSYHNLADFKHGLLSAVEETQPEIVALAGFMMILAPEFIDSFRDRIVNIHPSLLPKFPGLTPHAQALEACEQEHGCTVHIVDRGVDTGPIIAQAAVPVLSSDDVDTLAVRVLALEHQIYPWTLSKLARGEISIQSDGISFTPGALREATSLGFRIPNSKIS